MSRQKRGVLTSLVSLTAISLLVAGCGSSTGSTTPSAAPTNEAKEPVSLKIMGNYDSPTLSEADQKFVKSLEEKNNVKVQFDIPPITGYAERLQLMLASGTYPDLVFFPGTTDVSFQNAVKDGILLPVNAYIDKFPELKKYTYPTALDSLKVKNDGDIYGIPRTSILRNDGFWVRNDWLQNVGVTVPADGQVTIEQFEDILKKFTFNDPDKNGKNDTYGYAGYVNVQTKVFEPVLTGPFGALGWQESKNGTYKYMDSKFDTSTTRYKDALAFTAKLYKEGVFDPDSATNDDTKSRERFWRGMTGVYPGFAGHYTWHLPEIQKQTPSADLTYIWVKGADGKILNAGATGATGAWGFWAITKTSKNPLKAAQFLNSWITDDTWTIVKDGYEGNDYTVKDGQKVGITPLPKDYVRTNTMRRAYDESFFIKVGTPQAVVDKIKPWLKTAVETAVVSKDLGYVPEAAKKPNYQDYKKTWDQTIMKIIMGKEPVDKFTELQSGWYKNGGDEYAKQMNDYIAGLKK
ncbi:extracellular solute-binding protein [Paenibacillus sp. HWE-109]|uniref:extracellular solute-binding protein n=1 Tax=Paenibacillus sp. HWE-109 TaxID=1306526 RepID=UPI001EE05BDF|nr:extracellular solute-binding protein [Paenibacillus sp. HWE-109]UKS24797.1 extracellular solute-binding protein [Paenibacillus sp. HWE-109]